MAGSNVRQKASRQTMGDGPMAATRGARTTRTEKIIDADHHAHGLLALSPLSLFALTAICAIVFWIFTSLQITATEASVFGLLQQSVHVEPGMTVTQLQQIMAGSIDRSQQIAAAIGWSVQIALLMLSFPPESALLTVHRKFNIDMASSLSEAADNLNKVRSVMMAVLIGGDILTDFVYVVSGHNLIVPGWFGQPSINPDMIGVLLIGVVYPIAICFVTVFVGKYVFVYGHALYDRMRHASK